MIQTSQILETLRMIDQEKLDVRTITMGISLFNCVCDDKLRLASRVYRTVCLSVKLLLMKVVQLQLPSSPTGMVIRQ